MAGTLFIVFLALKLAGAITWSWWWVFAPIWIDVALTAGIVVGLALFGISAIGVLKAARRRIYRGEAD